MDIKELITRLVNIAEHTDDHEARQAIYYLLADIALHEATRKGATQ